MLPTVRIASLVAALAAFALLGSPARAQTTASSPKPAAKPAARAPLKPAVIKIDDVLARGLTQKAGGFQFSVLAEGRQAGVELFQIEEVKTHFHPRENHFLYIIKGRARGKIGTVEAEVGPGDLVVIPAGKAHAHKLTKLGDEPVVFLLFSSPPFNAKDIVWTEK